MRNAVRKEGQLRHLREEGGQALVLGALSMFLMALMLMASFNLTQAVHEKIRLQQHTDAVAYSMAVVEARAMNYFAYSNRAMAAAYVAMTTLHAYMASATVTAAMLGRAKYNFYMVAAIEFALCATCCWPWCFSMCKHCIHGIKAIRIARKFGKEAKKYGRKVKSVDRKFQKAVSSLERMIQTIYWSQQSMLTHAVNVVRGGSSFNDLKQINAPKASSVSWAVGGLNVSELACALENTPLPCLWDKEDSSKEAAQKVMTDVANATRPKWPAKRSWLMPSFFPLHLDPRFLSRLMHDIQGSGITMPFSHKGTAKMVSNSESGVGPLHKKGSFASGKVCGAGEHGMLFSYWKHGFGIGSYKAWVYSNGSHKTSPNIAVHQGSHKFDGVNRKSGAGCLANGNCFVKYRAQVRGENFPAVYAHLTQDLSLQRDGTRGPWEITDSGKLSVEHGEQGTGEITLRPGTGRAVSKALVYYHKIGPGGAGGDSDWKDPPNLFMPYWRAKLDAFDRWEVEKVLMAAGDTDSATVAAVAPVN